MIQVWQANNPTFGFAALLQRAEPGFPRDFTHVADLDTDNLDDAFGLSQHIDRNWLEGQRVLRFHTVHARSTSVGDVLVLAGKAYVCENFGWRELGAG